MVLQRKDGGFDERSSGGKAANRAREQAQFGALLTGVLSILLAFPHFYLQFILFDWYLDSEAAGYDLNYITGSILIVAINFYFVFRGNLIAIIGLILGFMPALLFFCIWLLGVIFRAIF